MLGVLRNAVDLLMQDRGQGLRPPPPPDRVQQALNFGAAIEASRPPPVTALGQEMWRCRLRRRRRSV
eukprot:5949574-Alexandrium_andersonii.AAC.1